MLKRLKFLILLGAVLAAGWFVSQSDGEKKTPGLSAEPSVREEVSQFETPSEPSLDSEPTEKSSSEKQERQSIPQIETEAQFRNKFSGEWRVRRTKKGKVFSLTGALIPDAANSEQSALDLVRQLKPFLAKGEYSFDDEVDVLGETTYIRNLDIAQKAKGFDVYQGNVSVFGRKSDGAAYMINNRLRDILPFETDIAVSLDEAKRIVNSQLPELIVKGQKGPLVFSDDQSVTELAWVISLNSNGFPPRAVEVVVSAQSGQILHQESRIRRD